MLTRVQALSLFLVLAMLAGCAATVPAPRGQLEGTSWQLVKFEGGDGRVLVPDEKAKYAITFYPEGRLGVRFDCNRGRGTWESGEPSELRFGALALTRAACPPGSLHDHMVRQWPHIRSYVLRDGHLFLALKFDSGIFEFEPAESPMK